MSTLPRLLESADFSPFFKSTVGFDRLMRMLENETPRANTNSYPPYNIEKISDDDYQIDMAVAGFAMDDIDITVEGNRLTISGSRDKEEDGKHESSYLYRGIATRNFMQEFQLADHIEVKSATLDNGMLHINLVREIPEEKKPRKIKVNSGNGMFTTAKKLTKKTA